MAPRMDIPLYHRDAPAQIEPHKKSNLFRFRKVRAAENELCIFTP